MARRRLFHTKVLAVAHRVERVLARCAAVAHRCAKCRIVSLGYGFQYGNMPKLALFRAWSFACTNMRMARARPYLQARACGLGRCDGAQ